MKYIEYKERKTHGTADFPIEFYHVTPSHPRYEMAYHWHMEYELIRILKGEFMFKMDEQEFTAREGDIILLHDGILHGGHPVSCVYECIVFDFSALVRHLTLCTKQIQDIINHNLIVTNFFPAASGPIREIVWGLFESMRCKTPGHELVVLGYFYQFFGCILEYHYYAEATENTGKNTKRINQLKSALELIETSYQNPISLDDLAKSAGMNAKYFCRFFQDITHRTPIDYLNYYRIERACFELATSDLSITEVALNCGFNDISYFIKTFKKYKGMTPKKYLNAAL